MEDGVNGGDFVGKEVEFVGGEFLGLLVEMELEGLGEFLFRVSRRGVFFAARQSWWMTEREGAEGRGKGKGRRRSWVCSLVVSL